LSLQQSIAVSSIQQEHHMAHKWIMAGLGLAVGMICYKMFDFARQASLQREDGERLETWEEEGGALPARERF